MEDFLGILIVGALLSGAIEAINKRYEIHNEQAKLLTIVLSLFVGSVFVWLQSTPWFQTVTLVLMSASTVYALLKK